MTKRKKKLTKENFTEVIYRTALKLKIQFKSSMFIAKSNYKVQSSNFKNQCNIKQCMD